MSNLLLAIKNCAAAYDNNRVLNGVNLDIKEGDFIGIIGPNGGGKSTLVKMIIGEVKPIEGEIIYSKSTDRRIGYLPQYSMIDKSFPITVEDIVLSGLQSKKSLFSQYTKADYQEVENMLTICGVESLRKRPVGSLSGGQLQRVLLSRAIISRPKLLILDEPNSYVDNKFEKELYELLKSLNKQMSIIMVSHDIGTITSYVKTIACVNRTLHYHDSNIITQQQLIQYDCPILLVTHGEIPHTVLKKH